ncbi:MAG: TonB-dependent receptor [Longimicrobiales bacterium]
MNAVLAALVVVLQAQDPAVIRPVSAAGAGIGHVRIAQGIVRGQVLSGIGGAPIPFAAVEVIGVAGIEPVITDAHGAYVLDGIPPGQHLIRASHLGHAPLDIRVLVPAGGFVEIDFALDLRPVSLPAVRARVGRAPGYMDTVSVAPGAIGETSVQAIESSPGMVEMGLTEITDGSAEPIDPNDVLYVRGAGADLKLVLLDGVPVYAPFHLAGLIAPFETEVLSSAELYIGGAPARYDGGLSHVLNLETRGSRSDALHADIAADMIASRARIEGPLGPGAGFMVGTRVVHGLGVALTDGAFPYGYIDGIARLDRQVDGGGTITATGFMNRESVDLEPGESEHDDAFWGNVAGSARYLGPLLGAEAEIAIGGGRFNSGLPIVGRRELWVDGAAKRFRTTADFTYSSGPEQFQYGISYERQWLVYEALDRQSRPDSVLSRTELTGDVVGGYFDVGYEAFGRVKFRGGVRFDMFDGERAPRIAPRLAVTWLAAERTALTLAAGRYHQYVRAPESVLTSPEVEDAQEPAGFQSNPLLAVARASHFVLSFDQQLSEGMRLGIEGFHKLYEGALLEDGEEDAQASGMDLWLRKTRGDLQGWLSYSLAWTWADHEIQDPGEELFAGRHLVSAGLLGSALGGRYGIRMVYGAGLPFTAIQPGISEPTVESPALARFATGQIGEQPPPGEPPAEPSPLVPSPDDPYLRVDAEVSRSWMVDWIGRPARVTPYLRVINALDRRDALFYHFDAEEQSEPEALAALPLIPVLGVGFTF